MEMTWSHIVALIAAYLDPRTKELKGMDPIDKAAIRTAVKWKLIDMQAKVITESMTVEGSCRGPPSKRKRAERDNAYAQFFSDDSGDSEEEEQDKRMFRVLRVLQFKAKK